LADLAQAEFARAIRVLAQPLATGSATKCIEFPDLIRIKTACFPADRASLTAWRNSEGVFHGLA
jgi:hypothetical protein